MVRPRVLVFGDSNSWGYPPDGSGRRMGRGTRWPGVFADATGAEVIEDCLPGRTVDRADPEMFGEVTSGAALLPLVLEMHRPLDLVLIMLGTNDLKARFGRTGAEIAASVMGLVGLLRATGGATDTWEDPAPPAVGVIAPPAPGARISDPAWERYGEWRGGAEKARALSAELAARARAEGVALFDAATVAGGADSDPIHLSPETHGTLGRAVGAWARDSFDLPWR